MSTKCQLKSVISHRIAGIIGITIPNIPYKNYMDTKYGCGYRDGIDDKMWESARAVGSHFWWLQKLCINSF